MNTSPASIRVSVTGTIMDNNNVNTKKEAPVNSFTLPIRAAPPALQRANTAPPAGPVAKPLSSSSRIPVPIYITPTAERPIVEQYQLEEEQLSTPPLPVFSHHHGTSYIATGTESCVSLMSDFRSSKTSTGSHRSKASLMMRTSRMNDAPVCFSPIVHVQRGAGSMATTTTTLSSGTTPHSTPHSTPQPNYNCIVGGRTSMATTVSSITSCSPSGNQSILLASQSHKSNSIDSSTRSASSSNRDYSISSIEGISTGKRATATTIKETKKAPGPKPLARDDSEEEGSSSSLDELDEEADGKTTTINNNVEAAPVADSDEGTTTSLKLNNGFRNIYGGLYVPVKPSAKQRVEETRDMLGQKLQLNESDFYRENPSAKVPRFAPRELSLGGRLGEGEFGAVYEIDTLERQPPPSSEEEKLIKAMEAIITSVEKGEGEVLVGDLAPAPISPAPHEEEGKDDGGYIPAKYPNPQAGVISGSLTEPLATDLVGSHLHHGNVAVAEASLDQFIRRKIDAIVKSEEQKPPDLRNKAIVEGDLLRHNPLHSPYVSAQQEGPSSSSAAADDDDNSPQQQYIRRRREAIKVKDNKGEMIRKNMHADDIDEFDGYAVKLVRQDIPNDKKKRVAAIDMASEAKLLSALSHPNIIRVRGILGYMEGPGRYGIIMDKLRSTLQGQIEAWARRNEEDDLPKAAPSPPKNQKMLEHMPKWMIANKEKEKLGSLSKQNDFFLERIEAVHDVAKAMRYLHQKRIIYRDLKPENVGYTSHGDYVLFDFGLSKELKRSDQIRNTDNYRNTTGSTGSRLFMAPEVARYKQYGFSADVYSYSIMFWEVFALQELFPNMTMNKHYQMVIVRGRRPSSLHMVLPERLNDMMVDSWSANPTDRPTFDTICDTLESEYEDRTTTFNHLIANTIAGTGTSTNSNSNSSMRSITDLFPFMNQFSSGRHDSSNNHNDDDHYNEMDHYYSDHSEDSDEDDDDGHNRGYSSDHELNKNDRHHHFVRLGRGRGVGRRKTRLRQQQQQRSNNKQRSRNKLIDRLHLNQLIKLGSIVPEPLKNIKEVSSSMNNDSIKIP